MSGVRVSHRPPFHPFDFIETPCAVRRFAHIDVTKWVSNGWQNPALERAQRSVLGPTRYLQLGSYRRMALRNRAAAVDDALNNPKD